MGKHISGLKSLTDGSRNILQVVVNRQSCGGPCIFDILTLRGTKEIDLCNLFFVCIRLWLMLLVTVYNSCRNAAVI